MPNLEDMRNQFVNRLDEIYGDVLAERIRHSMGAEKRSAYFLNPLAEDQASPIGDALGVSNATEIYVVEDPQMLNHHPSAESGRVYPINPASVLPVLCLDGQPGQETLDLAAAPGGKSLLMAALMGNQGRIAAVEVVKPRFHRLKANLERCGVTNVQFYLDDGRRTGRKVPERFDRVLLDAPCSSEARIRLDDPDTYRHWQPRKIKETSNKQRSLIRSAFSALRPGGEMVYCTCSFAPEENERVVMHLLKREPTAQVLDLPELPVMTLPGLQSWQGRALPEVLSRTRRVLPDDLWDGFYIARVRKNVA